MRIKKLFLISLFIFVSFASSFSQERVHADEYYCLTGPVMLRNEMSFSEDALVHTTLNHEGGLAFKILKTGKREKGEYSEGIWLYVILTCWVWDNDGKIIPENSKWWLFLNDEDIVHPY